MLSVSSDITPDPFGQKRKQSKTTSERLPDNIVYTGRQAFIQHDTDDGFEADIYIGQNDQRSDRINENDLSIIASRNLNEPKYRELKVMWATYMSAAQASKTKRGLRGYGKRTLEKYWSAMNAANPSPSK